MKTKLATLVLPPALAVSTFLLGSACLNDDAVVADEGDEGSCDQISDMSECDAEQLCVWDDDVVGCVPDCALHQDQDSCAAIDGCIWEPSDGGFCDGPLT